MPTYEYKCENCGNQFEIYQSIKDNPLKHCKECGKDTLKRIISSSVGLIFKGTGFYLTDYKRKSSSEITKKQETKTESKSSGVSKEKKDSSFKTK
ncbi:MAG: zinc ribbon domain-containing protein [Ignavibacteria bacterium]|nr:zinc ribbon domain-containing protein [Ignavibacteria bacterium]